MVSGKKKNIIIFLSIAAIITLIAIFSIAAFYSQEGRGILHIEPGKSYLWLKTQDLTIDGLDKDGVTYFFLPSFAEMTSFSQDVSMGSAYLLDGTLLSEPSYGAVQEVTVKLPDGTNAPWKISFLHSDCLYTAYIDLVGIEKDDIAHDEYSAASLKLFSPFGKIEYTKEDILIKGRGNTTWDAVKRPYEIKLPENYPLCGLKSSSKWALLANFYDDTKIQNKLIMDLSGDIGMEYAIDSDWIDLYLNGEYLGNYLLCKDPGIGKGRLEINNGCLIEKDHRTDDDSPVPHFQINDDFFKIKDPLPVTDDDIDSISLLVREADTEIRTDKTGAGLSHIDIPSFTRRFMIDEFCFRSASMETNCYFYNKGNRLYAGPCWDYDLACGKPLAGSYYLDYTKSLLDKIPEDALDWDSLLMKDKEYKAYYNALFKESVPVFEDVIFHRIDAYADRISASLEMDRARWQNDETPIRFYSSPEDKYRYLKFFLYQRLFLLANICGYDENLPEPSFSYDGSHTIKFLYDDGSYETLEVPDGTLLGEKDLPGYGSDLYKGWEYEREDIPFSPYIPVYEDMTLVVEHGAP